MMTFEAAVQHYERDMVS